MPQRNAENAWPPAVGEPTLPPQITLGTRKMAISLYDVSVASFLQTLNGVAGWQLSLEKLKEKKPRYRQPVSRNSARLCN